MCIHACAAKLQLDKHVREYWYVNQAEITINGVDDKEEFQLTDVRVWAHIIDRAHLCL